MPASQVVGGPEWIKTDRYDIEAKPAANADPKQIWQMWEKLLSDSFKLKLHRETRELPVYILTAAENGLKLPAATTADCVSFPPGTKPRHVPGKVDCGYVSGPFSGNTAGLLNIRGNRVHISDVIPELALILDRPVIDQTGFHGEFDLNLSFTADANLKGLPGYGGPSDASLPNILAALEEQLGLKLTPAKRAVQIIVIDHAERPSID